MRNIPLLQGLPWGGCGAGGRPANSCRTASLALMSKLRRFHKSIRFEMGRKHRHSQLHRYTATGFANDVCQAGKVYAGRRLPFPRFCRAWSRSVVPIFLSRRDPVPFPLGGGLCSSVNTYVPMVSMRRTGLRIGDRCALPDPVAPPIPITVIGGKVSSASGRKIPPCVRYR